MNQADTLLHAALEMAPGQRDAYLREACKGDSELEREVRSLVEAHDKAGSFLDRPAVGAVTRDSLTGQTVSHYRILEVLGTGGMGVVYKAQDTRLDRLVALKFLPPHLRHNQELKQRLKEEARAASALDHSNIVVIHDIGESPEGDLFIAMAFHEGATLAQKIEKPIPVAEALEIARQIASGLSKAHECGIFHRDIKPSNVIVAKDGVARIIDFGLAKSSEATVTEDGSTKGTPLYMSPEQASGKAVDYRTDLWSLGAVLYQMLAGKPPFSGDSQLQVMHAIVSTMPRRLREARPDLPAAVDAIVMRALEKDPAKRYQSAAEMARDLAAAIAALSGAHAPVAPKSVRAPYVLAAVAAVVLAAVGSLWFYQRSEKRHWAREQGIPEIARLTSEKKPLAAFLVAQKALGILPGDPQVAQMIDGLTHVATVRSTPVGATVEIKDYLSPGDAWYPLGTTPLENVRIPAGYFRWRVLKAGTEPFEGAPTFEGVHGLRKEFDFSLDAAGTAPKGMVPVPKTQYEDLIWSMGVIGPYDLPAFYMDRFEVANRQYQEFVDRGGYQKREYWKERFIRDGKELSWEQAMDLFRDASGRLGPSTWEAGHFPAGQEEVPVGGVSWYEAAAYAAFAGKSLPTLSQWYLAAPSPIARYVIQLSNFSQASAAPVGKYQGIGPWGTYDMAGNIGEWVWNEAGGGSRYSLGGTWNTASSDYFEPGNLPPFTRTGDIGFRCVKNSSALPAAAVAEIRPLIRDFSKANPASDEIFKIYRAMYAYDRAPLNTKQEPVEQDSADWHKEKVVFNAAYRDERMAAYLFVPANVRPPYQTIVFFPSARVTDIPSSKTLGDMKFIDYVIKSGRAVLYPVFKGTYERPGPDNVATTRAGANVLIEQSKDLGRSIDYLETRTDIDMAKIGYLGVSMGAAAGVNFAAVEQRLRTAIFLDGGFYVEKMLPGTDQADFAPRIKIPVLLISGKYDWVFLGKDALMKMLGTPPADKKVVFFDTAHDVSEQRPDLVREVVAWLDKYFGRVNQGKAF